MLRDTDIEQLFVELSIHDEGRKLIRHARMHSPVRELNSRLGNCIVWHYSKKMGCKHLELESRTVEGATATVYEDDPACLEFWPQPFRIDLSIKDENGKVTTRKQHTPDFLIIEGGSFYVDEWREEARLLRLAAAEGSQFYKDNDHRWHNKAAEEYFEKIGLKYRLRSALELPRSFIMNTRFLEDYQKPTCTALSADIESNMVSLLAERGSVPFLELLQNYAFTADSVFKALVSKVVSVDLYSDRLDETGSLMIHRDMSIARAYRILKNDNQNTLPIPGLGRLVAGSCVKFDGTTFEIILVGGGNVLLNDADNKRITLPVKEVEVLFANGNIDIYGSQKTNVSPSRLRYLADLSAEQIEAANNCLDAINNNNVNNASPRSIHRWNAKIKGAITNIDKLIALANRNQDKGNRTDRLPEKAESLAEESIRCFFNTPECRTALAVYAKYQDLCEEHGVSPMSYPTFTKRVKDGSSTKLREGKRKDYQDAHIPLYLDYAFPVHGVRPHEVCYIDHTIMNIATIGPEGTEFGKPTFTLATDGHTTQARAFYLSYNPPSSAVVLMTLRDYVRRNNRIPKILSVDGGKEFKSKELEIFCSDYEIDLRHRPPGKPRGGSPVERAMGSTETELLAKLEGNTRIMKNARMVTKSVNPFPNAAWTLTALHGALNEYLFEIRDNRIHPSLGITPYEYEKMRLLETGAREHTFVRFDQNIMLMTSPHTKRMLHKIDQKRGIWADNMYYWNDNFRTAKTNEKVKVRVEPWNANVVYVNYRDKWVAAIARDLKAFGGRTRREVELALREERRRAKVNGNKDRLSKVSSKKMLGLWSPEKFDDRIGKQQQEMSYLYSKLGMTMAMPMHDIFPGSLQDQLKQELIPDLKKSLQSEAFQLIHAIKQDAEDKVMVDNSDKDFWGDISDFI